MPMRVPVAYLRALGSLTATPTACCSQCPFSRSLNVVRIRTRILTLRAHRTGNHRSFTTGAATLLPASPGDSSARGLSIRPAANVNKPLNIPASQKDLRDALERLAKDAALFVGTSRLGLALRGLERRDVLVRVAVLAMGREVAGVRRLVRLLLADPLGKEEAWERQLVEQEGSVIIKYAEEGAPIAPSRSPVQTLTIPSHVLRTHGLEILISCLPLRLTPEQSGMGNRAHDAILVPEIQAQTSTLGIDSHLTFPVHKTLLVGEGLKSLVEFGRFVSGVPKDAFNSEMVQVAAQTQGLAGGPHRESTDTATVIDIEIAEKALDRIRESIDNALDWEHGWFQAGIPPLSTWLITGISPVDGKLQTPLRNLITSLLNDISAQIAAAEQEVQERARASGLSNAMQKHLIQAISTWSEAAHVEMQEELDIALASRNWARLKWFKLFWRSDDVSMILEEIMERRWLVEAEKGAIYLAGRIEGAGFGTPTLRSSLTATAVPATTPPPTTATASASTALPRRTDETNSESLCEAALLEPPTPLPNRRQLYPYPHTIPSLRSLFSSATIPALQSLSQSLVLQCGTGISVSAALTGMAYFAFQNATLFEAGAVLAFGTVISLRRLQGRWETARENWAKEVREEGRRALRETEAGMRSAVQGTAGAGTGTDEAEADEARLARERAARAVDAARDLLARA